MNHEITLNKEQFEKIKELWEFTNKQLESISEIKEQLGLMSEALIELNREGIQTNLDMSSFTVDLNGTEIALSRIYDTLSGRI